MDGHAGKLVLSRSLQPPEARELHRHFGRDVLIFFEEFP